MNGLVSIRHFQNLKKITAPKLLKSSVNGKRERERDQERDKFYTNFQKICGHPVSK